MSTASARGPQMQYLGTRSRKRSAAAATPTRNSFQDLLAGAGVRGRAGVRPRDAARQSAGYKSGVEKSEC